ncbi:MAG: hypothetical protein IKB98_02760 [Clostridia bacterium]|nr:hypothetical protein [Clostridia bacterium]
MKEKQKAKAIELMKQIGIYKPYIDGFEKEDQVCFFEQFAGFWVYQEPDIEAKMKQLEKEYECRVYAITHELTQFGECYSFLIVTAYEEEWDRSVVSEKNNHYAFAYVWNKDDDWCSEFGTIVVKSYGGGIKRIG